MGAGAAFATNWRNAGKGLREKVMCWGRRSAKHEGVIMDQSPVLVDLAQPTKAQHRQALREAGADAMESFGRPSHWRAVRGGKS